MDNFLIRETVKSATNGNYNVIATSYDRIARAVDWKIWQFRATGAGLGEPVQLEVAIFAVGRPNPAIAWRS
ncbi:MULTISPECIES: hypothetical protein [unclassified Bradyrhizobium]|uniref:hypothetical protein n=1 Tax=unclassified Bradyrhizobium TaxID=2631580 RepID=UPI002FF37043